MKSTTASLRNKTDLLMESSSEDDDFEDMMNEPPTFSQTTISQQSSPAASQNDQEEKEQSTPTSKEEEEKVEAEAQRKANHLSLRIADSIKSPSELYWHRQSKKKDPFPVRLCDPSEISLAPSLQKRNWNRQKDELVQYLGEYKDVNERALVGRNQLTPFNGSTGNDIEWCPNHVKEYVKQIKSKKGKNKHSPVMLRVEVLYLDKILQRAVENQAAVLRRAKEEEEAKTQEVLAENEVDEPQDVVPRKRKARPESPSEHGETDKNHKLRAGDVIEYTHPQYVDGREDGYRRTAILSIKKKQYPLILENAELLPREHRIRRIERLVRGKLNKYNGKWRALEQCKLEYDKLDVKASSGIAQEAKRVGSIVDKNVAKFQPALEETGLPMDLLHNMGGKKRNRAGKENATDAAVNNEDDDRKVPAVRDGSGQDCEATSETAKRSGKRVRESPTREDSSRRVRPKTDSASDCIEYLEEELRKFQQQETRPESPSTTMTKNQIQVAVKVWRTIEGKRVEELSHYLSNETDIGVSQLEVFLTGDRAQTMASKNHAETEIALMEWLNKKPTI